MNRVLIVLGLAAAMGCGSSSVGQELMVGGMAPGFTLPDQNGVERSLSDYRGQQVLIYFYPKDFTPGCTTEACSIRDNYAQYKTAGIVVLGISGDSVESHKAFEKEHGLPFTLLSDVGLEVASRYGSSAMKLFAKRHSFLVGADGKLLAILRDVDPSTHSDQVMAMFSQGDAE